MGGRKNASTLENRLNIANTQKKLSKDKCENYRGITFLPQLYKRLSSVL
jgi:hypothetical protein